MLREFWIAIFAFAISGANSQITTRFDYYVDSQDNLYEGYLAFPSITSPLVRRPAVIIFHTKAGRTEFENQKARDLAQLGYVAFAADLFGLGADPNTAYEFLDSVNGTAALQDRVISTLNYVKSLIYTKPSKVASIGYGFGGRGALNLARSNVGVAASVTFHGEYGPDDGIIDPITATVVVHEGAIDPAFVNDGNFNLLAEMRRRRVDWTVATYAGANSDFTLTTSPNYSPVNAGRAWTTLVDLLAEKLA